MTEKKSRIWEVDFLRGICVLLMVFDHIMYDFGFLFGNYGGIWYSAASYAGSGAERIARYAVEYWRLPARETIQPIVAATFVLLSGISSGFSKNNIKRGLKLGVFALLLTLVTLILETAVKGVAIRFGVLHMLSAAMILFGLTEYALNKIPDEKKRDYIKIAVYSLIGLLMILIGIPYEQTPYEGGGLLELFVYSKKFHATSADYFTILPWAGFMFIGAVVGRLLYPRKKGLTGNLNDKLTKYTAPVNYIGKIAVWVYLLHQVIVFLLLYLLGLIFGFGGIA